MTLNKAGAAAVGISFVLAGALGMPAALAIPGENVVLRAMDKITARVSTITVPVGGTVTFGSLKITAKACDKHPPEETPEASAFLDVVEEKPGEAPQPRFQGWMFASSPALSALEHPVYDLWVLDCTDDTPAAEVPAGEAQPAEGTPAPTNSNTTESGTSQ
nr:DUF2155 domain-containing protein [uncultured Dongia sp.]